MLAPDEVQVWTIPLELPEPDLEALKQTLSEAERSRAGRLYFERHRRRFVAARGMLRRLLGGFLGLEPERVELRYGPHGKPCVEGLRFNLAHSHELALYAFSRGRELGVDLERIRPLRDAAAIAERYFSAEENAVLRSLPEIQRHEAFFRCWTRKEAYLKALGDGLARPLDSFDVTLAPGEPARLLRVQGAPDEAARWSLLHLDPAPGFVGALAAEGPWGSTQLFQAAGDLSAIERIVRNTSFES